MAAPTDDVTRAYGPNGRKTYYELYLAVREPLVERTTRGSFTERTRAIEAVNALDAGAEILRDMPAARLRSNYDGEPAALREALYTGQRRLGVPHRLAAQTVGHNGDPLDPISVLRLERLAS